ncbi:hypothetical protein K439DRAFT_1383279 [Ramaria rubella]|nr:hypothetical protein K439DRAFT_1383279 [Ramaria rubella]
MASPNQHEESTPGPTSLLRSSWYALADRFTLPTGDLPKNPEGIRQRSTRADRIPQTEEDEEGQRPTVRDYHSISAIPPCVRIPKKLATPIQVEGKVWFANERTWISYLDVGILLGTFSIALFNGSQDKIARDFAYAYAVISIGILIYGYVIYQKRITMIKQRYPGHFDQIVGPVIMCILLFLAVLANFIIRVKEMLMETICGDAIFRACLQGMSAV